MKPRTKIQRRVAEARKKLPPLTPAQIQWGYEHCIEHIGRCTPKGIITCTACGHKWPQMPDQSESIECPHCHRKLTVATDTLRRTFYDYEYLCVVTRCEGFQVFRYVYIECKASINRPPIYTHIEAVQRWIAADGQCVTFARLRPMGYFVHGWCYSSPLEMRRENERRYSIIPTAIYPRQYLIPEVRRRGYRLVPEINPVDLVRALLLENKIETLLKTGQLALGRLFAGSSKNLSDYWPSIRIAIRNGYSVVQAEEWCDYLDLRFFTWCPAATDPGETPAGRTAKEGSPRQKLRIRRK